MRSLCSFIAFVAFQLLLVCANESPSLNGGTFLALVGQDSVVLATDSRFVSLKLKGFMLSQQPRPIYRIGSRTLLGAFGLESDSQMLVESLTEKLDLYSDDEIEPKNIARLTSDILYNQKLTITPLIAGLSATGNGYLCSMDSIGAQTVCNSFCVVGSASSGLLAICESLYQPNCLAEELVLLAERCLRLAFERNVLSGGNMKLVTLTKDGVFTKEVEVIGS